MSGLAALYGDLDIVLHQLEQLRIDEVKVRDYLKLQSHAKALPRRQHIGSLRIDVA